MVKYELVIYDRAGDIVYHSDNINEAWDGTKNGRICNKGTYMYKIYYSFDHDSDNIMTKKGTVFLFR